MSPEYLHELADLADPGQLWRLSGLDQVKLPDDLRKQVDMGVALRRHADHLRQLREALRQGKSLLITPLSVNGSARMMVDPPQEHAKLQMPRRQGGDD